LHRRATDLSSGTHQHPQLQHLKRSSGIRNGHETLYSESASVDAIESSGEPIDCSVLRHVLLITEPSLQMTGRPWGVRIASTHITGLGRALAVTLFPLSCETGSSATRSSLRQAAESTAMESCGRPRGVSCNSQSIEPYWFTDRIRHTTLPKKRESVCQTARPAPRRRSLRHDLGKL
jgi:hypothetical protein